MSKIKREKYISMDDFLDVVNPKEEPGYKLVRESDGLTKLSNSIKWIEFNDNGNYKGESEKIKLNTSLLMSPFNRFFTWQTTPITEIVENTEGYIKFKTKNSNYELFKL